MLVIIMYSDLITVRNGRIQTEISFSNFKPNRSSTIMSWEVYCLWETSENPIVHQVIPYICLSFYRCTAKEQTSLSTRLQSWTSLQTSERKHTKSSASPSQVHDDEWKSEKVSHLTGWRTGASMRWIPTTLPRFNFADDQDTYDKTLFNKDDIIFKEFTRIEYRRRNEKRLLAFHNATENNNTRVGQRQNEEEIQRKAY